MSEPRLALESEQRDLADREAALAAELSALRARQATLRADLDALNNDADDLDAMLNRAASAAETEMVGSTDRWVGTRYGWLRQLSSRRRGKAGEVLFENWARSLGLMVGRTGDSQADRKVGDCRVEVKLSTLWENETFCFQQIRDQDYAHAVLLGVTPERVSIWVVPKAVLWRHAQGQHGGATGTDTRWLQFDAAKPPRWLSRYGGQDLAVAADRLRALAD